MLQGFANAQSLTFKSLYNAQFKLSTYLIKPNYLVILPIDTAPVSLDTYPHYSKWNIHVHVHVAFVDLNLHVFDLRWFPQSIRARMAKIKLPKNPHTMVIFWRNVRRFYWDLSSQADPARENWT